MAATGKKTRRKYSTPEAVNGNLARKLDSRELERRLEQSGQLDFDKQYRRRQETAAEQRSRQRAKSKAAVRLAQKVSPMAVLGFVSVAGMMVILLLFYVEMNSVSRDISSMKAQISQLEVEQVALLAKYEQSFDLATVQEIAEAAGMTLPSESQTYYIDLPGEDQVVSYSGGGSMPDLDGISASISQQFHALLEYFR